MSLLEITVDINGKQIPVQTADDLQWLLRIMDIIEPDNTNTRSKALKASWTERRKVEQSERMRETWRQRREERP